MTARGASEEDLRCARTGARHRPIYRDGKKAWTQRHRSWTARQRFDDALAQRALEQQLIRLEGIAIANSRRSMPACTRSRLTGAGPGKSSAYARSAASRR
jgi:hypothetical protein